MMVMDFRHGSDLCFCIYSVGTIGTEGRASYSCAIVLELAPGRGGPTGNLRFRHLGQSVWT